MGHGGLRPGRRKGHWLLGMSGQAAFNQAVQLGVKAVHGPSPRVRGTDRISRLFQVPATVHPRVCGEQARLTPHTVTSAAVHPRVCGEQGSETDIVGFEYGPSPRVRGTGLGVYWVLSRFRGGKPSSPSLACVSGRRWNLSIASAQAASRTAIMGRPSRSTKVELARPWARRP